MKKYFLLVISTFVLIGLLIAKPLNEEQSYAIKRTNAEEVVETFNLYKDDEIEYINYSKRQKGANVLNYDNKIYLVEEYSLIVFNLDNQRKEVIEFEKFQPLELVIENEYLYIIGVYDEKLEIDFLEEQIIYDRYICEILILDIYTLKEVRSIRFDQGYYATSYINGEVIYLIVHIVNIIDEVNNAFIFPSWTDSAYGKRVLKENDLYLSKGDKFNNVMTLIVKIDNHNNFNALGIIGVEGFEKIIDGLLVISSPIYSQTEETALHIIRLANLKYLDYVHVYGYLAQLDSFDVYQNYFRVAIVRYQDENIINKVEIFDLNTFRRISSFDLPQNQYYNYLEFNINTLYLSPYDTKQLIILDLVNGYIDTESYNFYIDKIVFQREYYDVYGKSVDNKGVGTALCIVRQRYDSKEVHSLVHNISNLDLDIAWNPNSINYYKDVIVVSCLKAGKQKIAILKNGKKMLFSKLISIDDYYREILFYDDSLLITTYSKIFEYSIESLQLINTYLIY